MSQIMGLEGNNFKSIAWAVAAGLGTAAVSYTLYLGWKKLTGEKEHTNPYEEEKMVDRYMAFHYASPEEYLRYRDGPRNGLDFPKRCAELCFKNKQDGILNRALDIGCSVGRSTFELTREFEEVMGIDYSRSFIHKCQELKMIGQSTYSLTTEGRLEEGHFARIDQNINRTAVSFMVGDACQLPNLGQFDCVLAANLICRLLDPMKFFQRLPDMIVPGGILVITSPYTWLEQYTPESKWIGGYRDEQNESDVRGFQSLKRILGPTFKLVEDLDMPFLLRESTRKYQWTVAHASVWRRRDK